MNIDIKNDNESFENNKELLLEGLRFQSNQIVARNSQLLKILKAKQTNICDLQLLLLKYGNISSCPQLKSQEEKKFEPRSEQELDVYFLDYRYNSSQEEVWGNIKLTNNGQRTLFALSCIGVPLDKTTDTTTAVQIVSGYCFHKFLLPQKNCNSLVQITT